MAPFTSASLLFGALGGVSSTTVFFSPLVPNDIQGTGLLQTWSRNLDSAKDTPVTRVVNLLKEMSSTLEADMEKDEALYHELSCWCQNGDWEKSQAIKASTAKIDELQTSVESLTAQSSELATHIQELETEVSSDKTALAEASALREKQLAEFHEMEKDSVQAVENLRAAITVLGKHFGEGSAPESTVAGGAVFKSERDSWSFLQTFPWQSAREGRDSRVLDDFMRHNGFGPGDSAGFAVERPVAEHKFLQQRSTGKTAAQSGLSEDERAIVKLALKSASAFVQAHQGAGFTPAYQSQSGEILGVLKQLKEEMEGELAEAQKREQDRAGQFHELRNAKESEIANGEKMSEIKEDEHATTDNNLAEAHEDLGQEEAVLAEDQEFLKNLKTMCADGGKNFELRKKSRMEEMKAVSETIEILMADEARDAMGGTFSSFVQVDQGRSSATRARAASALRAAARRVRRPELTMLATSVQLDAFDKVKKSIDDMVSTLKVQQADEVKKNDFCKSELHENEMDSAKATDKKAALESKIAELESTIQSRVQSIKDAKAAIAQQQLDLQRASEDRMKENLEFQKTIADQTATIEVLKKALDKLATFYDSFAQIKAQMKSGQTPPVPQMEYSKSAGASGVMQMIEKLVYDAKELMDESKKGESEAQAGYETAVQDTNNAVAALQKEIVSKTKAKAQTHKDKLSTTSDHSDTVKELDGHAKENANLHGECDYTTKNFGVRQDSRNQEIEALQQAKQILNGAALS